jgi:hypothetical protein
VRELFYKPDPKKSAEAYAKFGQTRFIANCTFTKNARKKKVKDWLIFSIDAIWHNDDFKGLQKLRQRLCTDVMLFLYIHNTPWLLLLFWFWLKGFARSISQI